MTSQVPRAAMVAAALVGSVVSHCSWFQRGVTTVDPVAPAEAPCDAGAVRCDGLVPERCEVDTSNGGGTRWWPTTPRASDGTVAPCAFRCVTDSGVAHCAAPEDASTP